MTTSHAAYYFSPCEPRTLRLLGQFLCDNDVQEVEMRLSKSEFYMQVCDNRVHDDIHSCVYVERAADGKNAVEVQADPPMELPVAWLHATGMHFRDWVLTYDEDPHAKTTVRAPTWFPANFGSTTVSMVVSERMVGEGNMGSVRQWVTMRDTAKSETLYDRTHKIDRTRAYSTVPTRVLRLNFETQFRQDVMTAMDIGALCDCKEIRVRLADASMRIECICGMDWCAWSLEDAGTGSVVIRDLIVSPDALREALNRLRHHKLVCGATPAFHDRIEVALVRDVLVFVCSADGGLKSMHCVARVGKNIDEGVECRESV